jgi:hypothetical protein
MFAVLNFLNDQFKLNLPNLLNKLNETVIGKGIKLGCIYFKTHSFQKVNQLIFIEFMNYIIQSKTLSR